MSKPQISKVVTDLIAEVEVVDERGRITQTKIPAERPLTLYLDRQELVTLMTLGANPEALTVGYLRNQRFIQSLDELTSVQVDWDVNTVSVMTHEPPQDIDARTANKVVTTGCGQGTVFGGLMEEVDVVSLPPEARISQKVIYDIVDAIRGQSTIYKQAGSVHACALFSSQGELLYFVEDIGRHNAVDAIAGLMWLDGHDGGDKIFYTTGRLTSEMVIKGAQMGIPCLMSRSGTTEMGHAVANRIGMALLGRCSGRHFLVFSGRERVVYDAE